LDHADHVNLLREGVPEPGGVWADIGAGGGAFTLALAELIGPGGQIYAIDKDRGALRRLQQPMQARFPEVTTHQRVADFSKRLDLPPLDGIVMANALHFQPYRKQESIVRSLRSYLRPGGRLIVIEYNTDSGNYWVPHPFSFQTWRALAHRVGFSSTTLLSTRPSRFLGEIYSAVSV
jgi:precorrin-6B methylase 2